MTIGKFTAVFLAVALLCLFALPSQADDVALYRVGPLPDYQGLLFKGDTVFAVFYEVEKPDTQKLIIGRLVRVVLGGKKSCTKQTTDAVDFVWTTKACVNVKQIGKGRYRVYVVMRYDHHKLRAEDKASLRAHRDNDFVKERRYDILFSVSSSSCSSTMKRRSYIPLNGKNQVPSTVGDLRCSFETSDSF
jgi:hypothetical protein